MPLTFAHPTFIFFLKNRRNLSFTALIIGSIIPDFEHFLIFDISNKFGHTILGVFLFDLPFGLVVYYCYKTLIHPCFKEVISLNKKDKASKALSFIQVLNSLGLGVFSHLFFDGLTSRSGYLVKILPFLQTDMFSFIGRHMTLYIFLWYIFTTIGTIILIAYFSAYIYNVRKHQYKFYIKWRNFIEVLSLFLFIFSIAFHIKDPIGYLRWGVLIGGSLLYTVVGYSLYWRLKTQYSLSSNRSVFKKQKVKN
ncbi:DUF4184 family protein [Flammeovirga sp. MY04]|uniref:DUF4184 family protein n=1 Tax=Flammeovirga sp. MY04 TaxID=1191459 RepID=UPI0008063F74|nr:DUF4184 family protein [Flammeovirga sp. MY04]ANQ48377.1 DUF4184 family protein [Flammeovirga sp. MY04]